MPAMIRLAAIGAARNWRIAGSIAFALLPRDLLQRRDELRDVVLEQLDVVGGFLHAADRRREHEYLAADLARDRLRRLQAPVRLDDDELAVAALHLADQTDDVRRRRRDAWLRLDVANDLKAETLHEV